MTRNVLVTGGAGYIGSHACKVLAARGYVPVAFDNLSTGWAQAVKFGPLVQGDLMDRASLDAAFAEYQPVAVMHSPPSARSARRCRTPANTGATTCWAH
jgi:UDP-galactose 4-epimerase (EC 5.1.3.2)